LDDHATIYEAQDLAALVAWLRHHRLLHGSYDAEITVANDDRFRGPRTTAKFSITEDIIPLPRFLPEIPVSPFVQYQYQWAWYTRAQIRSLPGRETDPDADLNLTLESDVVLTSNSAVDSQNEIQRFVRQRLSVGRTFIDIPRDVMAVFPWFLSEGPESQHTINPPPNIDPIVIIYEAPAECPWFDENDTSVEPELRLPTRLIPLRLESGPQFLPTGNDFRRAPGRNGRDRGVPLGQPRVESAEASNTDPQSPALLSFALKNAQAEQIREAIQPFFSTPWNDQNIVFSTDARTNILLVQGPRDVLQKVEAMIKELDIPSAPGRVTSIRSGIAGTFEDGTDKAAGVNQLREAYLHSDRRARQLAHQTQLNQQRGQDDTVVLKLRNELRQTVARAFAARQELHKAQIAELRRQLEELERSVEMREQLQEQIIAERVEELLK
jgi:hypothetical protein